MKQKANIDEVRFDVWCGCGRLVSVYGEDDGTIFHRCGACDKRAFKGVYTLTLELLDARGLEDVEDTE